MEQTLQKKSTKSRLAKFTKLFQTKMQTQTQGNKIASNSFLKQNAKQKSQFRFPVSVMLHYAQKIDAKTKKLNIMNIIGSGGWRILWIRER